MVAATIDSCSSRKTIQQFLVQFARETWKKLPKIHDLAFSLRKTVILSKTMAILRTAFTIYYY